MSIDEFMQFALDVMKKKKSSMTEFKTRFMEVKKVWIENHKGNSKLFDEEEEEEASVDVDADADADADANAYTDHYTDPYANLEDNVDYSRLFPSMYGDMTYSVLQSRHKIDYVKGAKAIMKQSQEAHKEGLKQELQKKIAEKEFDIRQIDVEIQNAKRDHASPEQLEVLMQEKKELQNSLYQMKRDLRSGIYTNSL